MGDRRVGPHPALDRGGERRLPGGGSGEARRVAHARERRRAGVLRLLELDRELAITRDTTTTFQNTADLFGRRYSGGIGNLLEVSRANAAVTQARSGIAALESQIVAKENQLATLLGRPPGTILRGTPLEGVAPAPQIPVGLPSQLLECRPDIQEAEQQLAAANADVGVALANFFPRLGLTALYGGQSSDLDKVVKAGGGVWAIGASVTGPVFEGGRLLASYRVNSAAWDEAVERYQQSTVRAFAEASNSLVAEQKLKLVRKDRDATVTELKTSVTLSLQRYDNGVASYF